MDKSQLGTEALCMEVVTVQVVKRYEDHEPSGPEARLQCQSRHYHPPRMQREYTFCELTPGTSFYARVASRNSVGMGQFSPTSAQMATMAADPSEVASFPATRQLSLPPARPKGTQHRKHFSLRPSVGTWMQARPCPVQGVATTRPQFSLRPSVGTWLQARPCPVRGPATTRPGVSKIVPFHAYYSRNFLLVKHIAALACFPSKAPGGARDAERGGSENAAVHRERRPGDSYAGGEGIP